MATDLFAKYYNNPTKSYIYTNMTCNGASADEMSFDITGSDGVISNNENVLSSLDLSGVHVPLTEYSQETRTLNPYEIMYVRGFTRGESYMRKAYEIKCKGMYREDWMLESAITFVIRYIKPETNDFCLKFVKAMGDISDEITFIEACQDLFDKEKIPVNITFEDDHIIFTSSKLGFEFWVSHIILWQKALDPSTGKYVDYWLLDNLGDEIPTLSDVIDEFIERSVNKTEFSFGFYNDFVVKHHLEGENIFTALNVYTSIITQKEYEHVYYLLNIINGFNDVDSFEDERVNTCFLFEDFRYFIPAYKYRNGAFKGVIIAPTYPVYNANEIHDYQKALRIVHIEDRVKEYSTSLESKFYKIPLYVETIKDVIDSFSTRAEYDRYCKWCRKFDEWCSPDEIPFPPPFHDESENNNDGWSNSSIPDGFEYTSIYKNYLHHDYMGLYGFCNYATENNRWMTFGNLYARTTVDDDESTNSRNLIPSFIIYNPNSFPVSVKYMTFI